MSEYFEDRMVPGGNQVLHNMVVAGDASLQGSAENNLMCYAVCAIDKAQLSELEASFSKVIEQYVTGSNLAALEIHAKQIWNGSERFKTPFSVLGNKDQMKAFFFDLCNEIARVKPFIVVSVASASVAWQAADNEMSYKAFLGHLKALLIYAALSRLDINVNNVTGKHIGEPEFFLDFETDKIVTAYGSGLLHSGYAHMREVGIDDTPEGSTGDIRFYRRIYPKYVPTDSASFRLIQVADLAAYFVGKHLVLFSELLPLLEQPADVLRVVEKIKDANTCLRFWDLMDLEAVLAVSSDQVRFASPWMRRIMHLYQDAFDAGVDLCSCSIREAALGRPKSGESVFNGIGYIGFVIPGDKLEG